MSTLTPNYNLSKPEPTDRFGYNSFLPLFNDNMDKIDQIGGGSANQNIAENYDDTLTYSVGDYVIYNGLLYKCDTAVTTAETFDPTKWTHVVVTDEMGSGGGSANIVNCTQAEYDTLPSSKESDNVLYVVYFDGGQTLDPDYSYYKYGDNDEIIVRVYHEGQSDQQILWFFRGWNQSSTVMAIPSSLTAYAPSDGGTSNSHQSKNYTDSTGTTQNGWIGFYSNSIRAWSADFTQNLTGTMYGVVDPEGAGYPNPQTNPYVDDPYVYIQDANATRRIYMNGREYAEFNGSGGIDYLTVVDGAVNIIFDDGN